MASNSNPARPRLACEITAECVVAARAAEPGGTVDMHTIRSLPPGSVLPSLKDPNVPRSAALANAISDALQTVGGRVAQCTAVLPDAASAPFCWISKLSRETPQDAAGVVKLRMRKSLPFDVEKARLSYHVSRGAAMVKVIAAVLLRASSRSTKPRSVTQVMLPAWFCLPLWQRSRRRKQSPDAGR